MLARYSEYLVWLLVRLGDEPATTGVAARDRWLATFRAALYGDPLQAADMNRMMRQIDEKMAACLGRPLPEVR